MAEVGFRGGGFSTRPARGAGVVALLGLVVLWQVGADAGWFATAFLSTPASIGRTLWRLGETGELWRHVGASLGRLGGGWLAGTLAGLVVGTGMALNRVLRGGAGSVVAALFPIPKIALVPLFIIWFGIGEGSKLVTVGVGVFFPTVIGAANALDAVPRGLVRMGQSFGLSSLAIVWKILLPGALPGLLGTARITAGTGVILLVAAEMIGADRGIGAFVLQAGNLYDVDALMAGIVVLSGLGLAVAGVIGLVERVALRWR